ncbi:MAG TPA: TonB-dependent receptor [Bryobacteraceae bacterium]
MSIPRSVFALAFLYFSATYGYSQTFSGTILGTVQDTSQAVMQSVQVTVVEVNTGLQRSATSNKLGYFEFPLLPPGMYRIEAEQTGFKKFVRVGLDLQIDQKMEIPIMMSVGAATETVQVEAQTPLLETTSSTRSQDFESKMITEVPTSNRNFFQIAELAAGINDFQAGAAPADSGSAGFGYWSSNGGMPGTNEVMMDGATAVTANMGAASIIPTIDAIQEFKLSTNALAAEFGRTGGAVLNAIYKSGTNQLHGTIYDFARNSFFNSSTWLNNRSGFARPYNNTQTFGYTVGGPVWLPKIINGRNKLFFFNNYEGYRNVLPVNQLLTVPTVAERTGDFSGRDTASGQLIQVYDPLNTVPVPNQPGQVNRVQFPGNVIPANRINPVAAALMKYYPLPNAVPTSALTNANNYVTSGSGKDSQNMWAIKTDYNINTTQHLFVRYTQSSQGGGAANFFGNTPTCSECLKQGNPAGSYSPRGGGSDLFIYPKNVVVGYTNTITPHTILDLRYAINRQLLSRLPQSSGFNLTDIGMPKSLADSVYYKTFPAISITSYQGLGTNSNGDLLRRADLTHAVQGSVTYIAGAHTIKAGGDYRLSRYNDIQASDVTPSFSFSPAFTQQNSATASPTSGWALASFLLGLPSSGTYTVPTSIAIQYHYVAGYIQDDWRITKNLTLNIGLRYDLETPFTERYNHVSSFDPNATSAATKVDPNAKGGLQFMTVNIASRYRNHVDGNNLGPRIGLVYAINERTVIHTGYGILYQPSLNTGYGAANFGGGGFDATTPFIGSNDGGVTTNGTLSNPYPAGFVQAVGSSQGANALLGQSLTTQMRNIVIPYTQQFNFTVQRQMRNWLFDIGYVGTRGIHQWISLQGDQLNPIYFGMGSGLNVQTPNPFVGLITTGSLAAQTVSIGQLLRPYPQFSGVTLNTVSAAQMKYDALELKAEHRYSKGFAIFSSFTWSKNLGNTGIRYYLSSPIQNAYDLTQERSISPIDIPKVLKAGYTWDLPIGKGRLIGSSLPRAANFVVGGWQTNGIVTVQSGLPLALTVPTNSIGFGAGQRPNNNGQSAWIPGSQQTAARMFNTSVFSQPAAFTFGNVGPYDPSLRGQKTNVVNLSLFKNFQITERLKSEFRFESFNAFNHPIWATPGTTINTATFGVSAQKTGNRTAQVALKLLF